MFRQISRVVGCASVFLLAVFIANFTASAQDEAKPPPAPPPMVGDDFEKFLTLAPSIQSDEVPGLQLFTVETFESGDIAWVLAGSAACLFILAPGLLLFYAGWLRPRELSSVGINYVMLAAVLSLMWVAWGYSITFARNVKSRDVRRIEIQAPDHDKYYGNIFIGGTDHVGLRGLDSQMGTEAPRYPLRKPSDTVPHILFVVYQLAFFIAVPAPLVVALAGRMRTAGLALFVVLWGTLVYAPITYWVWGGGWHTGTLDTAGGITAQLAVGFAALAAALTLKPSALSEGGTRPDVRLLTLGTVLIWAGASIWTATRTLAANGYSVNAFLSTHLAACTGMVGWAGAQWLMRGKAQQFSIAAGPLAGITAIAAGAGYVVPQSAMLIGLLGGIAGYFTLAAVQRAATSSPVWYVFALHGVPGLLGGILAGIFATPAVAGFAMVQGSGISRQRIPIAGLLSGNPAQLSIQAFAIGASVVMAILGTLIALLVVRLVGGFVKEHVESIAGAEPAATSNAEADLEHAAS